MPTKLAVTLLMLLALAHMPSATAQRPGDPGAMGIDGLNLQAEPTEVTLAPGSSATVTVLAEYTGSETLQVNVTALALPGGGFGAGGRPGSGRPQGDGPTPPSGGPPPGNFTRPPGGFPGTGPGITGMTLTASPSRLQLAAGTSATFAIAIESTTDLAAGDYQVMMILDGGDAGRAAQAFIVHVEASQTKDASFPPVVACFVVVLLAAVVRRAS